MVSPVICRNPLSIRASIPTRIILQRVSICRKVAIPYQSGHQFLRKSMQPTFLVFLSQSLINQGINSYKMSFSFSGGQFKGRNPLSIRASIPTCLLCMEGEFESVAIPYQSGHQFLPSAHINKKSGFISRNPLSIRASIPTRESYI